MFNNIFNNINNLKHELRLNFRKKRNWIDLRKESYSRSIEVYEALGFQAKKSYLQIKQ